MASTALEECGFALKPLSGTVVSEISSDNRANTPSDHDEIVLARFGKAQQLKVCSRRSVAYRGLLI